MPEVNQATLSLVVLDRALSPLFVPNPLVRLSMRNLHIAAGHPARLRPGPRLHTIGQTQGGTAEVVHLDIREDQETDVLVMLPTNCGHSNVR